MVRRLVGSFVKEGTSEGACDALDEAEAFEAVRDRLISTNCIAWKIGVLSRPTSLPCLTSPHSKGLCGRVRRYKVLFDSLTLRTLRL